MAVPTLKDLPRDKLRQAARYLDRLNEDGEEYWRIFIKKLPRKMYTLTDIETFAEAILTDGSPSMAMLDDLKKRNMTFVSFIDCLKKMNCISVINVFTQCTTPIIEVQPPPTLSLAKGSILSLNCVASCQPPAPLYQWYSDNVPLLNKNSSTLIIDNVSTAHNGVYYCVVSNPTINDESLRSVTSNRCTVEVLNYPVPETTPYINSQLNVMEDDLRSASVSSIASRGGSFVSSATGDITIVTQPADVECRYNEEFQLQCRATSISRKSLCFKWFRQKARKQILLHEDKNVTNETSIFKNKISKEDTAVIYCVVSSLDATPTEEVVSNKVNVTVHSIWFEVQPSDLRGINGHYGYLQCKAAGKGSIEYMWFKVNNDGKKPLGVATKDNDTWEFPSLSPDDWGKYVCQAQNVESFVESNIVQVNIEPDGDKLMILRQPHSYACVINESVILQCDTISPHSITNYQWHHNSKPIESSNNFCLKLSSLTSTDFGEYHCTVTGGHDDIITSRRVKVMQRPPFDDDVKFNGKQAKQYQAEYAYETIFKEIYVREKVALLIGNQNYPSKSNIKSLSSPHDDVLSLSDTLKCLGFKVFSYCDMKFKEIMNALDFIEKLIASGVLCVFYYSGHGFDYRNDNYLIPTDVSHPIKCNSCISVELIANKLQLTNGKIFMFLDCCRVHYDDSKVVAPHKPFINDCGYANIIKIWSSSVSKPAYERKTDMCSVFNVALTTALKESTHVDHLGSKILDYMQRNALSKDKQEFQRPTTFLKMIPTKLTMHEMILFDCKTSDTIRNIETLHYRKHYIPSVRITSDQLKGLAYCNVDFSFLMTNIINVHINVVKLDRNNSVDITLDPSIKCADPLNRQDGGRLLVEFNYSFTITSDQRNNTLTIFTIHVTSSSGTSVANCPCDIQLPNDI